ncbi:MAG: D-2-hydroxyacid dehydrogenase [Lachnospiraceae bacterium]|nr:D-2-hydroxyacid dehydrogenase [Lachnospiraceae bacterium]
MAIRILVTDGMDAAAMEKLRNDGFEMVEQFYAPDELGAALRDFDCVIIRSATKIRKPQIDAALGGNLKLIIRAGVGVDNIDVKYAEEKGIAVKNTPKASSQSVAELAMAHMFSCARFISAAGCTMREGKWEKKAYSKGIELAGKTLGIVGFGRIGQRLGVMAKGIGMNVIAFDIFHIPGIEEQLGIPYVEMDELLARADFISVHAPAVDGGALINAENIAKMKDGVVIINTSRGTNLDEAALLAGLESGKVRAAGLDVFADEPASNSALYNHPMVSSTPHVGAGTKEATKRIGAELVQVVEGFFKA